MAQQIDGMDAILVYLSNKYEGDWMKIYESLQIRENVTAKEVMDISEKLLNNGCDYISLINDSYPENLKSIYKPPFGVFAIGDSSLIKGENAQKNTVTVIGDPKEALKKLDKDTSVLWVNKSEQEIKEIIKLHPRGNIFYESEIKEFAGKEKQLFGLGFQHSDEDGKPTKQPLYYGNCIISEIFEKGKERDYSNQLEERIYLGITKKALITENANTKDAQKVKDYARMEDIQLVNSKQKSKGLEMVA